MEYDPGLVGEGVEPPLASRLDAGWPNPFGPALHGEVLILFALHRPSRRRAPDRVRRRRGTAAQLRSGGELRPRHMVSRDGTNESGALVGSGIYYALLEAEGVSLRRSLAVVRDR